MTPGRREGKGKKEDREKVQMIQERRVKGKNCSAADVIIIMSIFGKKKCLSYFNSKNLKNSRFLTFLFVSPKFTSNSNNDNLFIFFLSDLQPTLN